MQVKKTKMIFELFTNKISEFTFVSIFADMTILRACQPSVYKDAIVYIEYCQYGCIHIYFLNHLGK